MLPFYLGRNLHTFRATQNSAVAVWGIITNRPGCQSTWQKKGKSWGKTSSPWGGSLIHKANRPWKDSSQPDLCFHTWPTVWSSVAKYRPKLHPMWTRSRSCPEAGRSTGAATGARDWVLALPVPYSDRANPSAEMRPDPFWWDNFPRDLLMANNLKQRTKYCHPSAVSALIRRDNFTQHNLVSYFYRSLATLTLYWIMRSHCGLILLKSGSDRTGGDQINEVC